MGILKYHIGAGSMDRQIIIQSPVNARTASGQVTKTWTTVDTVWAQRVYGTPAERSGDKDYQEVASNVITWTVRKSYSYTILSTWRVKYNNEIYMIDGPPMEIGRRYIQIKTLYIEGNTQ